MPRIRSNRLTALLVVAVAALARVAAGQTIDEIRDSFRSNLANDQFAKSFAGLSAASDELDLAGAHYSINDQYDSRLAFLALPYSHGFTPWGEDATGIYAEAAIGLGQARQRTDDAWSGSLPGFETAVDTTWTTASLFAAGGPQFTLAKGLTIAPLVGAGLSYVRNDTNYSGPGAAFTQALVDGLAFNWDAWTGSVGTGARVAWEKELNEDLDLELMGRYDLRWTRTMETDDPAQTFSERSQTLTLRADLVGPLPIDLSGGPLRWRATVAYRNFLESTLFDIRDFYSIGGGVELDHGLPIGHTLSVQAAVILGKDLTGYSLGLALEF